MTDDNKKTKAKPLQSKLADLIGLMLGPVAEEAGELFQNEIKSWRVHRALKLDDALHQTLRDRSIRLRT